MNAERQLNPEALGDHIDRLYRAAWGLCGSREEAEDLVQETFFELTRRVALAALPRHTAALPIACVEGWSTTQTWSGVRLADLAVHAGVRAPATALVRSVERGGPFATARLTGAQLLDPDALLATSVNGVLLSLDHGYPARVIVPALPGVHCTKWVGSIDFQERS